MTFPVSLTGRFVSGRVRWLPLLLFAPAASLSGPVWHADAKQPSQYPSGLDNALGKDFRCIGTIQSRQARDITGSTWSIGAETMDRDFTIYANWRRFLGPLGVKKARIQSGWAKTETKKGVYDWAWVDEIVDDMVDQGVEPWVCLCYGNPLYSGGGGVGLGGGLVSSDEAMQAWRHYVAAFVERYAKHVDEWEVWNEPRTGRGKGAVQYAKFVVLTAETIRKRQPNAEILVAAGGAFDTTFTRQVLEYLRAQDKIALVDTIVYHPYSYNPDDSYGKVADLRKVVNSFSTRLTIRQGENGAPSKPGGFGAIAKYDWTEQRQAKWALRRLLGDLGHDIPSSYFAICDMKYPSRVNYKGLLAINDDKTVHHAKLGYAAVQHVTAVFDDTVKRIKRCAIQVIGGAPDATFAVFGYRAANGNPIVTLWRSSDRPGEKPNFEHVTVEINNVRFEDPVWVDLLTGKAYAIDDALWKSTDRVTTFVQLPVFDSAVVIADRKALVQVVGDQRTLNDRPNPEAAQHNE